MTWSKEAILSQIDARSHDYVSCMLDQTAFVAHAELIDWLDNPSSWGGAWEGKYALAVVADHSHLRIFRGENSHRQPSSCQKIGYVFPV